MCGKLGCFPFILHFLVLIRVCYFFRYVCFCGIVEWLFHDFCISSGIFFQYGCFSGMHFYQNYFFSILFTCHACGSICSGTFLEATSAHPCKNSRELPQYLLHMYIHVHFQEFRLSFIDMHVA